jgi:hypothetical protein
MIFLHAVKWLVCITDKECVYYAARTGSVNSVRCNCSLTTEAQVRYQVRLYEIYCGQSGIRKGVFSE